MASCFSSSPPNWVYDVFPSFSGEDVRTNFLSHFLKELDRKLILAFKDNEIERSQSLDPELKLAIRTSKIAVVVFSENYASSSWCLNELLEILKCKKEFGQLAIPVFYRLDPSHVRKQTGKFGEAFLKTCQNRTEDEIKLWGQTLTDVANLLGYHFQNWDNEAKMIEDITNEVLKKLLLTASTDSKDFVGIENHIVQMSALLHLESEEVRIVGIWGCSGIGKTTIARALYSQLSRQFQGSIFIDKAFVSKSKEIYKNANPDDYNMKLHLLRSFLSGILDKKDIRIDCLGAVEERLKHRKVIIFIDDLDDQMVLDTLAGETHWFGHGSRIIVITKDKHFLRAHGIDYIYEVSLPSEALAFQMFCRSAFKQNSPPHGLMEIASEIALRAGNLPLGLKVLGSYLWGREKEDLIEILPSLRNRLNGKIERTLRVSYDGLNNKKDEAIFLHIACLFNGETVNNIKQLLEDSDLDVKFGLKNLIEKSLIHVRKNIVEMHCLLQEMGKEIVRTQSNEQGERELLVDPRNICDLLEDITGTKKVIGIALDMDEIDELHIHENAFKGMPNLRFLKIYSDKRDQKKKVRWHLPEGFDYFPNKLRLLRLDGYPMRYMPSNFRRENLVKLEMKDSKLEMLWEGVHSLRGLKVINMEGSKSLKEIPDLSMATNLEELYLNNCSSLVELSSSIQYLNKLERLYMSRCINLKTLPTGINLQSLNELQLYGCTLLKIFPDISTNISGLILSKTGIEKLPSNLGLEKLSQLWLNEMKNESMWEKAQPLNSLMTTLPHSLEILFLSDIESLVELPASIQNFTKLTRLRITNCINLETLPTNINLQSLDELNLSGCSRLRTFPDISTNISMLNLSRTSIEEVPWWIENFCRLHGLDMNGCSKLQCVSLHISKLKNLYVVYFSNCEVLKEARWNGSSSVVVAVETDKIHSKLPFIDDASSSFLDHFINCFLNFDKDPKPIIRTSPSDSKCMMLSGEEVPSYFTHRTTETSLTNIHLRQTSFSQSFFRFKVCVVVDSISSLYPNFGFHIQVSCRFKGRLGNHSYKTGYFSNEKGIHVFIFGCGFSLSEDNASRAELNYDHVDIQLHLSNDSYSTSKLIEWGIRLSDDFSSQESQLGNPNTRPHVETERSDKRIRIT